MNLRVVALVLVCLQLLLLARCADDLCEQKRLARRFCFSDADGLLLDTTKCSETLVRQWLTQYETDRVLMENKETSAAWDFAINITSETQAKFNAVSKNVSLWRVMKIVEASRFPPEKFSEKTADFLRRITTADSPCRSEDLDRLVEVNTKLAEAYSANKACFWDTPAVNACLTGADQFGNAMMATTDHKLLATLWTRYHDGAASMRPWFTERVRLLNQGALENNYSDHGYFEWYSDLRDPEFLGKLDGLLADVMPLYRKLHAYVRHKLVAVYPGQMEPNGAIPVHLTGDLWGQSWGNILRLVKPFASLPDVDITARLKQRNITARDMFEMSEQFFVSLGLFRMTETFWRNSMLEQPQDGRVVECHASAWDFAFGDDYRIKMCTDVTHEDFNIVHHEMGHVQYFMAYRSLPFLYRDGANTGFHEAIGDAITLSVMTPEHLRLMQLIDEVPKTAQFDVNYLFSTALNKVAFLPFAYMLEAWRWATFNGSVSEQNYNTEWWRMRYEYGGMVPPSRTNRNDERYFDPGAKYHVATNVPYLRYFLSYLLEFQFYEAMCREAGHQGPLHRCDFYNSTKAGAKLKVMLSSGSSRSWQDTLEQMTGSRRIQADSLLRYFAPLNDWLDEYIRDKKLVVGWQAAASGSASHCCCIVLISLLLFATLALKVSG